MTGRKMILTVRERQPEKGIRPAEVVVEAELDSREDVDLIATSLISKACEAIGHKLGDVTTRVREEEVPRG